MNFSDTYLQIDSKNKLYLRKWLPKKINKNIFIVHGLGEHSGRYEEFAKILTKKILEFFVLIL
jgi:alpha-beta hydrolase superfamily lysophospholipase